MSSSRSDKIQYIFSEISVPTEVLDIWSSDKGLTAYLNPWNDLNEQFMDLREQLFNEIMRLASDVLTPHQKEILDLLLAGNTQQEIAKSFGNNQSSINKALLGTDIRNRHGVVKKFGGLLPKLRKAARKDEKIQEILMKIGDLNQA